HVGPLALLQLLDLAHEVVEAAAEAGAGHLGDGQALGAQVVRIHEVLGLVVGDDADALAAALVKARQPGQGGRFAGSEEAAHHHETQVVHDVASDRLPRRGCISEPGVAQSTPGGPSASPVPYNPESVV